MAPRSELIWISSFTKKQLWNKFLMEIVDAVRKSEGQKCTEMRPLAE